MRWQNNRVDSLPAEVAEAAGFQEIRAGEARQEASSRWALLRRVDRALAAPERRAAPDLVQPSSEREVSGRYDLQGAMRRPLPVEVIHGRPERESREPAKRPVPLIPAAARRTA